MKNLLLFCSVGLALMSCKKSATPINTPPPTASFTISKSLVNEKEVITISNNSKGALAYVWDFGDGTTSKESLPVKQYNVHGVYTITLTAINGKGESVSSTDMTVLCNYAGGMHPPGQ